jgi:AAA15 family ATPase/GTPase
MALDFAEESQGTQVLFGTADAWLNVMANGEVLLFDEIDASLHPLLVRYLIERFHSTSANPHNAQLICSTHNTSLQDRELFRRDQVWFVEKTDDGSSKIYPLTDFSPRNDESLERG